VKYRENSKHHQLFNFYVLTVCTWITELIIIYDTKHSTMSPKILNSVTYMIGRNDYNIVMK